MQRTRYGQILKLYCFFDSPRPRPKPFQRTLQLLNSSRRLFIVAMNLVPSSTNALCFANPRKFCLFVHLSLDSHLHPLHIQRARILVGQSQAQHPPSSSKPDLSRRYAPYTSTRLFPSLSSAIILPAEACGLQLLA